MDHIQSIHFLKFIFSFVCAGLHCLAGFSLVVENRCSVLASLWGGIFCLQSMGSRELRLNSSSTCHKPRSIEACASQLLSLRCRAWKPVYTFSHIYTKVGFPGDSDIKESPWNMGDPGSVPGSGGSPGEGNGHPLQYSCLEDSMDRGAWRDTVHGVTKSWARLGD